MTTAVARSGPFDGGARYDGEPPGARRVPGSRASWRAVTMLVLLTVLARLPFLAAPLSSDEAGFLMVGGQWSPGASLYGRYWVDRPPGLIGLFEVADLLGGPVALRLLGAAAAAVAVLGAALLARRAAPDDRRAPLLASVLVGALVSSPLLDVTMVDGEILALPFVLLGTWMLLHAVDGARLLPWALGAGVACAAAASIKQNMLDVAVVCLALALTLARRHRPLDAAVLLGSFGLGGLVLTGALVAIAWSRGTSPGDLWQAIVVFRADASAVIAAQASSATGDRGRRLLLAFVATGAPLVLALGARLRWRRRRPRGGCDPAWSWAVLLLLGWETFGVVAGGSYWLHYLIGLVPGLTLLLALSLGRPAGRPRRTCSPRRLLRGPLQAWVLAPVVVSTTLGLGFLVVHPPHRPAADQAVISYLLAHHSPGQTGVTAFGDPALLEQAGLSSPYPDLWSLPVRVHDPDLVRFGRLLDSPAHPRWVVMSGTSLASWGLRAGAADHVLTAHYHQVLTSGDLVVLRHDG